MNRKETDTEFVKNITKLDIIDIVIEKVKNYQEYLIVIEKGNEE